MSAKYQNIRVAIINEHSKVSFVNKLRESEFNLVKDSLQMELLTWLVSKHTTLYQGKEGEIQHAYDKEEYSTNKGHNLDGFSHK
jgi:hypothetical protein